MSFEQIEYPCPFAVKAMGRAEPGFESHVRGLVARHCPGQELVVRVRESSQGRYRSVTVEMQAANAAQIRAIYADLQASQQVLYAL